MRLNPKYLAIMWTLTAALVVALVTGNVTAAWVIVGIMVAFNLYAVI